MRSKGKQAEKIVCRSPLFCVYSVYQAGVKTEPSLSLASDARRTVCLQVDKPQFLYNLVCTKGQLAESAVGNLPTTELTSHQ